MNVKTAKESEIPVVEKRGRSQEKEGGTHDVEIQKNVVN